jgi:hypothetical protein
MDAVDELLRRILDASAPIKKRKDQVKRRTRYPRTRDVKYIEVSRGIFERLLKTVTNLSLKH